MQYFTGCLPYDITPIGRHTCIGLGRYTLDLARVPQPLEYDLPLFTTGSS